jgi:extracellular factor (EF) 3-hydroxypalmitic acid methyl ester biosynthesis protein
MVTARNIQPRELEMADLWAVLGALKREIQAADREAIRRISIPLPLADQITVTFDTLVHMFDEVVRALGPDAGAALGARVQAELLPYLVMSENAERWYAKPCGYAGDYRTFDRIYDDAPAGVGRLGPLIDRCFLDIPMARAIRNQRRLLCRELLATVDPDSGEPAQITSIAAGPAREVFDTYAALVEPNLVTTLIDFDPQALEHCASRAGQLGLRAAIDLVTANAIHLAFGRRTLSLADQDLVYAVGLTDSFSDELVVKLLDYIHSILRPGGRVIIGNVHPCNPSKAFLDHVLEWKLVHRDEDAMNALFSASAFGGRCSRIIYEGQGINLFAEGIKA